MPDAGASLVLCGHQVRPGRPEFRSSSTGLVSFSSAFPRADISSRNRMKICGGVVRMALARAVRSVEPVELLKPFNWLIRNVRA
jgi:hypothetical protein